MNSYIVKENHIISAVSEILRNRQTDGDPCTLNMDTINNKSVSNHIYYLPFNYLSIDKATDHNIVTSRYQVEYPTDNQPFNFATLVCKS